MGFLSNTKDRMLEQVALSYLNSKWLGPYGHATSLQLDSAGKAVRIEVELKGETEPLQLEVIDYELTREGERYFAVVKDIRTSREWLTGVAKDYLRNRRFEVPAQIGRMLVLAL